MIDPRPLPRQLSSLLRHCLPLLLMALPSAAMAGPKVADMVKAELIPGWQTASGTRMAALRLTMADGWKTYWRSPGDAGIPPEFNWSGSRNLSSVALHWPVPKVFDLNGMRSIGYSHELVLPIEVTAKDPGQPVHLSAEIDIGVCKDICVPVSLRAQVDMTGAGASVPAIRAALDDQAIGGKAAGLRSVTCTIAPSSDGMQVTAVLDLPAPRAGGEEVAVFEPSDPTLWVSDSETVRQGAQLVATSDLVPSTRGPVMLDRSALRITVLSKGQAVEVVGCGR